MRHSTGEQLGPYEIIEPIGAGGMGEVYKARDTRLNRVVAIKFAKDQFTERFQREARAVAALNHPHICQLYDIGPDYLVFEYIDGKPLRGPMPAGEAVPIAMQVADALEEAHSHGIVHRDLKPSNLLLTPRGVKVLDFGLAKQRGEREEANTETVTMDITRPGAVMGTPGYMAPEQWEGKPADARSDIYAFGCVLFELLTGARAGRERRPLKQSALEAVVRKCLADDPARRFQSAAELKTALGSVAGGGRTAKYALATALLMAIAAGVLLWNRAHAAPKLTDQDIVVVADFYNKTGDPVFDTALKQALSFQLAQSPFLKAMDDAEIRQTLKASGRSPDARVTGEVARDICIREGQKAMLEGSITALGSHYLLALEAVNCQTGETFAREQAEADSKEHVIGALDRATSAMRARLGESLSRIEGENRPYQQQISTTSLEALQAFYLGDAEWIKGDSRAAIPYYRHAAELDPNFALAFSVLGLMHLNIRDSVGAKEPIEIAYALRDHASERERLFIEQAYYQFKGDAKKDREVSELLARRYPRDPVFHGNLGNIYLRAGEAEKALAEGQAEIRNGPKILQGYFIASLAYEELNRVDEAKATLEKAIANGLDTPLVHQVLLDIAYFQSDTEAQAREVQWLVTHQSEGLALVTQANDAASRGKFKEVGEIVARNVELARQHPAGVSVQEILESAATLSALAGKCPGTGAPASPRVTSLCNLESAKKFARQQSAAGAATVVGPEAYIRGAGLLANGESAEAAAVFAAMTDRKFMNWGPEYAAAEVGLARAAKAMGDLARAKKAYQDFFAFWKDADPDVPLVLQAKKEYAALH